MTAPGDWHNECLRRLEDSESLVTAQLIAHICHIVQLQRQNREEASNAADPSDVDVTSVSPINEQSLHRQLIEPLDVEETAPQEDAEGLTGQ